MSVWSAVKKVWHNKPDQTTPLNEDGLNDLEDRLDTAFDDVEALIPEGGGPTGTAGGVLAGTYPDPTFAEDMATQAELDAAQGLSPGNTLSGAGVPDDSLGDEGDFYIQTDSDPPVIYGPKTSVWGDPITIGGGAMLSGDGPPEDENGSVGDFYVDLTADPSLIYGPKTDVWGAAIELSATTGAAGPAGGVLSGIYPNPTFAIDMATQAELDAVEDEIADISGVVVIGGVEPPTDDLGLDGAWWFNTMTGKLYGPKAGGVWDTDNPLLLGGIAVLNGALTPTDDIGGDGDLFVKTSTSELFVKDDGTWGSAIPLKGEQGDAGINLVNQGVWDSETTYVTDDLVQRQGSSWYATAGSTDEDPVSDPGTHWRVFTAKGDTGAVGAGFLPGLVVPAAGSCPPAPAGALTMLNNTGRLAAMNPIPYDGTLDAMACYIDTASGNIKFLIYDCGQATGGTYTQVFVSAPVPVVTGADWLTVTGIDLPVQSGDRFMFGMVADNGSVKCGRLATLVGSATAPNNSGVLPVEFAPTGVQVKMSGYLASGAPAAFTYATPAGTITEDKMQGINTIPCVIGQVS